ncbi:hypothetical protein NFHSH190041_08570 [Shewanella sp. NFH-SH190041]|nr:hypothetical protein NFHSH190041_08570 [Shewanella sp. NFH-SH190041]
MTVKTLKGGLLGSYLQRRLTQLALFSNLCLLGIGSAYADAALEISPQICIAGEGKPCHMNVELHWRGTGNKLICILSDTPQFADWCNDTKEVHSLTLNVDTRKDIQFVMVDKQNNQTLARVKLQVTQLREPPTRRRYRNPWSLF